MELLFTKARGLAGLGIRAFEGGTANHVAILDAASGVVIEATFLEGVHRVDYDWFLVHNHVVQSVNVHLPDEETALQFAQSQVGKKYDWTALVGFLMWRDWSDTDRWYCSELAMATLLAGGLTLSDKHNRIGVRLCREIAYAHSTAI